MNEEEEGAAPEPKARTPRKVKSDAEILAQLTSDVQRVLADLEALKKGK